MTFSPTLLELLTEPEFVPAKWQPLIEIQFNAPKLNTASTVPQLTFGTILNAAIIFTKALLVVRSQFHYESFHLSLWLDFNSYFPFCSNNFNSTSIRSIKLKSLIQQRQQIKLQVTLIVVENIQHPYQHYQQHPCQLLLQRNIYLD